MPAVMSVLHHVDHWDNEDEIIAYLQKVLNKEAFDHAGSGSLKFDRSIIQAH